jgi:hypothetical protein
MSLLSYWESITSGSEAEAPSLPSPLEFFQFLSRVKSPFVPLLDPTNSFQDFVTHFTQILSIDSMPDPATEFPAFLKVLTVNSKFISPQNADECADFIELLPKETSASFLIFKFAQAVLDPFLYYETILALMKRTCGFWSKFIQNSGHLSQLLEMHIPFLKPLVGNYTYEQ